MMLKLSNMTRAVLIIASLIASSGAQQFASIGPAAQIRSTPDGYRYPNGEVLHYTADWRIWQAGEATIRMDQVGSEQRITATANSTGFVALLFRVNDTFVSRFAPRSFCSLALAKHTEEGLHKRETNIHFDEYRRRAVLDERNLRNNEVKHTENEIPGCVTDVLSGIYYLRTLPLQVGATYVFPLNDGGQTVNVKAYVEAREEIKTDAGTFRTLRVQPSSETGMLKTRGKIWVWYSDDAQHYPVQMRARMFWGTLTIKLARVER